MKKRTCRRKKFSPATEMAPEEDEDEHRSGVVSRSGRRNTDTYWFKKKMEVLSLHFKPVAFPLPGKRLDIGAHESLLTRLGLWDFVNLDFDEAIREDLVKELVLCYKPKGKPHARRRCQVNGVGICINRTALANALRLPLKRDAKGGGFIVSKEEALFVEELIWSFLVLRDEAEDASLMSHPYMSGFTEVVREMKFETADWAGLVWFMVEREVSRGKNLAKCYYSSHLQILLKRQRPEWFDDHGGVGAGLESGQTQSILTKCGKRKREFLDDDADEGTRLRKLDLAGRELFLDADDDVGKSLRKLDLAGRELGGDDQGGNLDALCQSDMVDLLENGDKLLLNLQVSSNADLHSSDCDVSVTQPGYSESHTYNPSVSGVDTAEPKGAQMNDYEFFEGMERMQVQGRFQSAHVEERKNEGVMNLDCGGWKMGCCQKEKDVIEGKETEAGCGASGEAHHEDQNDMIEGGAPGAEFEINFGNEKKVDCRETSIVEEKAKGSAIEGNAGDSLNEVPGVKEDDEMEGKANEAECVTSTVEVQKGDVMQNEANEAASTGTALEMHCMKEDGVMQDEDKGYIENALKEHCLKEDCVVLDEQNEAAFEANAGNSPDPPCVKDHVMEDKENEATTISNSLKEEVNAAQDHHQPEFEFKHAAEKNWDSMADFSGVGRGCQEVDMNCMADDTGKEVKSVASVDLLATREAHDDRVKKEGSADGLDGQELENQQKKVNNMDNRHQSDLEFITEVAGNKIDYQEVDMNSMADNTGKEEESVTSVDFLVTQEAHDEVKLDSATDGFDQQKIENQQKKVDIIEIQYKPEVEFKRATEMYGDSIADVADNEMDCHEVDLNCMEDNAGREVESMSFLNLLRSTDGLDTKNIDEHWIQQKKIEIIDEHWAQKNLANEAVSETSTGIALEVHCMKEDDAIPDEASVENALKVHCMKGNYVVPDEPSEAHIGDSLIVPCKARDEFVEDNENETAFEAIAANSLKVHCKNEDDVMGDETNAVCEANILTSHEVHSEKNGDLNEEEENEAEFEGIGISVNVQCEKKDYVFPLKEQEAAFEANDGNSLGICGFEEDMMEHKECEANISDSLREEVNTAQDCRQPELKFKNEVEKNREAEFSGDTIECQEVYTGKEVESVASAGWLVAREVHDEEGVEKVCSSDGLDRQEMENQQVKNNIIENQHQFEHGFINATELNGDSMAEVSGNGIDCEETDLNCMADSAGIEVEYRSSVDLLVTGEAHDWVVKDSSTDGLDYQDIKNQQTKVTITENQFKPEHEFNSAAEKNGADFSRDEMDFREGDLNCVADNMVREVKSLTSVDLVVTQAAHDKVVKKDCSTDGSNSQDIDNQPVHINSCLENRGNRVILEISEEEDKHLVLRKRVDETFDVEMDCGVAELSLMQSNNEGDAIGTLTNQACEGNISDLLGNKEQKLHTVQPVQIDASSDWSDDEKCQNASRHLERGEGSRMNGITGRTRVSLGQFPLEGCNFGMTAQDNRIGIGTSNGHLERSMDLDHCAENVNIWMARLIDSAKEKVEESNKSNVMLQKKVEEQNELIQKYELMLQKERQENWQCEVTLHKERQRKQTSDRRYERELNLLNSTLQDYRKSIKQVNTSFAKYRERSQLPEGYMAHPDGGGRVVRVSEWEQEQQKKSFLAIEAMMEKFEEQWKSNLEEPLGILEVYDDRLGDLEHAIKTMKP